MRAFVAAGCDHSGQTDVSMTVFILQVLSHELDHELFGVSDSPLARVSDNGRHAFRFSMLLRDGSRRVHEWSKLSPATTAVETGTPKVSIANRMVELMTLESGCRV